MINYNATVVFYKDKLKTIPVEQVHPLRFAPVSNMKDAVTFLKKTMGSNYDSKIYNIILEPLNIKKQNWISIKDYPNNIIYKYEIPTFDCVLLKIVKKEVIGYIVLDDGIVKPCKWNLDTGKNHTDGFTIDSEFDLQPKYSQDSIV